MLSGFDPVRREIARLALTKLMHDGRIHPTRIEEVVAKARAEVEHDIRQAGEQAAYDAGVPGLPPGAGQAPGPAQVPHQLRPERAPALDRDAPPRRDDRRGARRRRHGRQMGGLLHDIGKAVDHEVEGPHAAIGAEIAQKHELPFKVVNGIAAHHQEVEYACLEALIVQAADAISAPARAPAARRGDLHQAARGAGGRRRELRRASRSRSPSRPAARSASSSGPRRSTTWPRRGWPATSSSKIEEQLTYPGQIKVTVIRETRAVEYAK